MACLQWHDTMTFSQNHSFSVPYLNIRLRWEDNMRMDIEDI